MESTLRNLLAHPAAKRIGTVLSLCLVAWIAWVFWQERDRLGNVALTWAFGKAALVSVAVVIAGNLLGSIAMSVLLAKHSATITLRASIVVTGIAQLAKYLPGNVVHLIGRFLYVQRATSAGVALWFSLSELALLATGAGIMGAFYLYYLDPQTWSLAMVLTICAILALLVACILPRFGLLRSTAKDVLAVLALYLVSYLAYGFAFVMLMQHAFGQPDPGLLLCSAVFALAFLGGYVTPGAPGGLGVREFLMMTLAAPLLDATAVLASVVLFRFLSIAGDLFFGLAALALQHSPKQESGP